MLYMIFLEVLVLSNEPLKLHPVHLLSSFDVITFWHCLLKVIHNFPVQFLVRHVLCLAAEFFVKI